VEIFLNSLAERNASLRLRIKSVVPVTKMVLWFISYYFFFTLLLPDKEALFAFFATAAIGIGLAIKDLLSNLFGGIVILLNRPFIVGDRVGINKSYGEIVEIGIISCTIQTPDDSLVTIPNSMIISSEVSNANSGVLHCQVQIPFFISLDAPLERIKKIVYESVLSSMYLNHRMPIALNVVEIYDVNPCIKITAKAYVFDARYENAFITDITTRVKNLFLNEKFNLSK